MDRDRDRHRHRKIGVRNDLECATTKEEMSRALEDSISGKRARNNSSHHHDDRRRHESRQAAARTERTNSLTKKSGKDFVLFNNRFTREKLSRSAVEKGNGLANFLSNNSPLILKNVWEKTLKPRSFIQIDNQSPSSSMLDSRRYQNANIDSRIISPLDYNERQKRSSLDSRIQSMFVPGADVSEPVKINTRHKNDERFFMDANREEVPMDIGSDDEGHGTPISDESMNRRDHHHHASTEVNHNYIKKTTTWNLDLEPLPTIKQENIKQEVKQEQTYLDRTHSGRSLSPVRLPQNGTLANYTYEENLWNSKEFQKDSPTRSQIELNDVSDAQNSEENHIHFEAIPMSWHCQIYLSSLKCHKGDYCDKLHIFPRENGVQCRDFMSGHCKRKADECWFEHPGEVVAEIEMDDGAPFVVQPMGELMKYIRKNISKEPDKYKSKVEPKKILPPRENIHNANRIPLGKRNEKSQKTNANMIPLGRRSPEQSIEDNYSPLQPRRGSASTTTTYVSNTSPESPSILGPRSKTSNLPLSYASTSSLDTNGAKPSITPEHGVSDNIDEVNKILPTKPEKDKNKYQFIKNANKSESDVDNAEKHKEHNKKRNDKMVEDNLSCEESDKTNSTEDINSNHDSIKDKKSNKDRDKDIKKKEKENKL